MPPGKTLRNLKKLVLAAAPLLCSLSLSGPAAAQSTTPPYKTTVFATAPNGTSQPDSIVQWRNSVIVGFGNGVAKDGTDGKSSTIVEYSLTGLVRRMFTVLGHNDGLRIRPETDELWALQNEDGNPNSEPNLVIIDLRTGERKPYVIPSVNGGGGYDDVVFRDDQIFITASNPNPNPNVPPLTHFPALIRLTLAGSSVTTEPVLYNDASATDIATGAPVTLNLTDPDSLTIDPRGNLVVDSQADFELVFIRHPSTDTDDQTVGLLTITTPTNPPTKTTVDDTAFAPSNARTFLLASDLTLNTIYRIDSKPFGFEPGAAYSASDTAGLVGKLDLDTGVLTPIVTGLKSDRGLLFVVPKEEDEEWSR